jgi:ABC-2 type transport system permease protein
MNAVQADLAVGARRRAPFAAAVITRRTAGRAVRSGAIWGCVFGITVASSALSYSTIYKTQAERDLLAVSFAKNHASSTLFGPAPQLQTVAGFTVFKVSMTLIIVGALWGLLTSTRLLRGEEDAGRWELLLSGNVTARRGAVQALAGLATGVTVLWLISALVTVIVGRSSRVHIAVGPGLYFALALVASGVMFLAIGALTSQLAATRRQAAGFAAVFLGVSYLLRMLADAGSGLHGLIWASPLGWVEELQPLTSPHPWVLFPIGGFTVLVGACAVYLAGVRDVGASVWPDHASAPAHVRLLSGPAGLTLRLVRPAVVAWTVAIAVSGVIVGLVAKAAGSTIAGSSVEQVFRRLGAPGTGADTFLGFAFLILAVLVSFVAVGQVAAARSEEAGGRLEHLLTQPVARTSWLAGRLVVAAMTLVATGCVAGVCTWLGAASEHSGTSFWGVLTAGLNVVPPAVFILGVGALTIGFWPRASSTAVYAVLVWSLLVELVGGFVAQSHWLLDTSLFHQMASAPAVPPQWTAAGVMVVVGLAGMIAGTARFSVRDLQGE